MARTKWHGQNVTDKMGGLRIKIMAMSLLPTVLAEIISANAI